MRILAPGRLATLSMVTVLASPLVQAEGVTINFTCGDGSNANPCLAAAQAWAKHTGNHVNLVSMPTSSTEQLSLYQQLLGAKSSDLDVIMVDSTWPGILGAHLKDLHQLLPGDITSGQFKAAIANSTVDGELKAMPLFVDASLLYYRKDLLDKYQRPVPRTWDEMTATARYIQQHERAAGHRGMWGYVFQGKSYEGLACNVLEWVASEGGGAFVDDHGHVQVDTPAVRDALARAQDWVGTIAPTGVLSYEEETSRGVFQSGNAVFMRNWPYAWAIAEKPDSALRGKIGVSALPAGASGEHVSTLGGWSFSVSRYSRHPHEAASLVAWLTSQQQQKQRAINDAFLPSYTALYSDPDVLKASPFIARIEGAVERAVPRPASMLGTLYPRYSNAVFDRTHRVLNKELSVQQGIGMLSQDMQRLIRRGELAARPQAE